MKKILGTLGFVLAAAAGYLFWFEPQYSGLMIGNKSTPIRIFSHRGLGNYAPDNSLEGIQLAMKAGFDGVDMDGQYTKDEALIIFHDLSVDRLTHDMGRVSDKTLEEMKRLDLGLKYGKGFTHSFPPTAEEALQATLGKGVLMVELKVPGAKRTGIEEKAVELIKKYKAHDSVYFSSFNPIVLLRLKRLDPQVKTVFIFMDTNWNGDLIKEIKKGDLVNLPFYLRSEIFRTAIRKIIKPDLLSVNHEVEEATISKLIEKGWPVFLWTPNSEDRIRWALSKKPMGIISDEPQLVKKLRDGT
jgi:glycerophosphoryl diester phosphodiesterase